MSILYPAPSITSISVGVLPAVCDPEGTLPALSSALPEVLDPLRQHLGALLPVASLQPELLWLSVAPVGPSPCYMVAA